jgi:hypothetical protein
MEGREPTMRMLQNLGVGRERVDAKGRISLEAAELAVAARLRQQDLRNAGRRQRDGGRLIVVRDAGGLVVLDPFRGHGDLNILRPRFKGDIVDHDGVAAIEGVIRHSRMFDGFVVAFVPLAAFFSFALGDDRGVVNVFMNSVWVLLPPLISLLFWRQNRTTRRRIRDLLAGFVGLSRGAPDPAIVR